jgi:S-formylglutathione hydrolase
MTSMISKLVIVCVFVAGTANLLFSQTTAPGPKGTVQRIKVHGKALEGNLLGESADPDVTIYLPPGYETNRNRRYPVVYLLHGFSGTDATWTGRIANVPEVMDRVIANKSVRDMIIVMPNAYNKHGGSMYSNSVTTGDWESYIAEDLVAYMDSRYRTIPERTSRGIAGHSMGGYGALRIGMKRPDVFAGLYNLSACCLLNNPVPQPRGNQGEANRGAGNRGDGSQAEGNRGDGARGDGARGDGARGRGNRGNTTSALASAWSPNPNNPPDYFDLPVKDGQPQPLIVAKWYANAPLAMVDQYVPNLKKYRAIGGDVGLQDTLLATNKQLEEALVKSGVAYKFETYEGDHTNRIAQRIETKVFPFFSETLSFVATKRK